MSTPPSGVLGRRNPTVKLALVFVVSSVVMLVFDPVTPAVLYVLAFGAVLASSGVRLRPLLAAQVPFVAFASGLLVVNALSRPGTPVWQGGPLRVSVEGLSVGAALAARTLLVGVLAVGFLASTDAVELVTSLRQNARLSVRVTYAVLAGYRMLQQLPREWATIRHAQAVRVPLRDGERPPSGPRLLAAAAFTLLVVSVRRGERTAQALESRGLGLRPRTVWRPVAVGPADWALVVVVLTVLAAVLAASAALGFLAGPGVLPRP